MEHNCVPNVAKDAAVAINSLFLPYQRIPVALKQLGFILKDEAHANLTNGDAPIMVCISISLIQMYSLVRE